MLIIWGAFSLVATIGLGILLAYQMNFENKSQTDTASIDDVRFVLNQCRLGEGRIEKVIHSYVSSRSFTGDHLEAYAIKVSRVEVAELAVKSNDRSGRWYRVDQLPAAVNDALEFVGAWDGSDEISWFPNEIELRSADIFVYPSSIYIQGVRPTAVELIFVRPSDNMVFYFSGKT